MYEEGWSFQGTRHNKSNIYTPEVFWEQMEECKAADYANILYIRMLWKDLEPEEGKYAWIYNEQYKWYIQKAKDKGLKLAFRVFFHGVDGVPSYVYEAGATESPIDDEGKTQPYYDNPVFLEKLDKFVEAFAKEYDNPDDVEMVTLDGGISLSVRNDASFVVGDSLSIYEHQSTVCPNMALRSLIYFVAVIKERISGRHNGSSDNDENSTVVRDGRNLYGKSLVKIPTPKFVVFYNGAQKQPEKMTQYLSDSFEQKTDDPELELKCKVYNINYGKNRAIMEKCRWLDEYMMFVDKVREYHRSKDEDDLEADINKAIDYCIENDVLKEFLLERRGEVTKVMALDYTFDKQLEMERADAWKEGRVAMSKLMNKLLDDGNIEEARRVTEDAEYCERLMKEYGII